MARWVSRLVSIKTGKSTDGAVAAAVAGGAEEEQLPFAIEEEKEKK